MGWRDQIARDDRGRILCEGTLVKPKPERYPGLPEWTRWLVIRVKPSPSGNEAEKRLLVLADPVAAQIHQLHSHPGRPAWHDPAILAELEKQAVWVRPAHVEACSREKPGSHPGLGQEIEKTCTEALILARDPVTENRDRNLLLVNTYGALREILAMLQSLEAIHNHPDDPEAARREFLQMQQTEFNPC